MANNESALTIPKNLTQGTDLVVVPKQAYEELQQYVVELKDALQKIQNGEKEYREGKTRIIKSLSELDET